jgi:hypothetical protein
VVPENYFFKFFLYLFIIRKIDSYIFYQKKKNLVLFLEKYFSFILDGKHFPEIMKNLKISYYLLIISNLILKLLIAKYFV